MTVTVSDQAQRDQAICAEKSFICEAPAGSGKTELLTQRFLNVLSTVQKPEQVLAITFTRKAAGEMRERVLLSIASGLEQQPVEPHKQKTWTLARKVLERDKQYHWSLLDNPNRLQIKTFDSLCASLAGALPLQSSFGAKPQIADDPSELYRLAARALLKTLDDKTPWQGALEDLLNQLDNRMTRLEDLFVSMLVRREEWLPLIVSHQSGDADQVREILQSNLESIRRDSIERLTRLIPAELASEIIAMLDFAAHNVREIKEDSPLNPCQSIALQGECLSPATEQGILQWKSLEYLLFASNGKWRKRLDKNQGFPTGRSKEEKESFKLKKKRMLEIIAQLSGIPGLLAAFNDLRYLPEAEYSEAQWSFMQSLFQVLPILSAHLTLVFKQTGQVDFAEISMRASQALGNLDDPSELALKLDYSIAHILVDEFQDTSYSQIQLLEKLTAGWTGEDGRTLFCVGDAMQSIYGFRGADVGLFLNCRTRGLGEIPLQPLRLNTNFRSEAGVVEWVNKNFSRAFPEQDDPSSGAVTYSESVPFNGSTDFLQVNTHLMVDAEDRIPETQRVLELIEQARTEQPDCSIAILVRSRSHAATLAEALKKNAVRFRAVELERLNENPVIQDLLALTRALIHRSDRVAWLSILRAPWCGLELSDLHLVSQQICTNEQWSGELNLPDVLTQINHLLDQDEPPVQLDAFAPEKPESTTDRLSGFGRERLAQVAQVLNRAFLQRDRKTLRDWVEGVWIALGGPACLETHTDVDNARRYFELLAKWPRVTDIPAFSKLQEAVDQLFSAPDPDADDRLQIMTIHKSKGLEFDVVILPGLDKRTRPNDPQLLLWHERINGQGDYELVMAPMTSAGLSKHPTYLHVQKEHEKKQLFESCRLLYVGCTRAKRQLHLLANCKRDEKTQEIKAPSSSSLLGCIWDSVKLSARLYECSSEDPQQTAESLPGQNSLSPVYKRLPRHWRQPNLPREELLSAYIPHYQYGGDDNEIPDQLEDLTARHIGTVAHRVLQFIGDIGLESYIERYKHNQFQTIVRLLRGKGVGQTCLEQAANMVDRAINRALANPQVKQWLINGDGFCASEYPVTLEVGGETRNLVIDRIYTDDDGVIWIIDYKVSEPEPDQTIEQFIHQQAQTYKDQLFLYKKAISAQGMGPVKLALYFPLIDRCHVY